MRLSIALATLLATASQPAGCGSSTATSSTIQVDPARAACQGLACGETCHLCLPGAPDCMETAVVKACDRDGVCQPATPALTCP
jgi:hypothetical protein